MPILRHAGSQEDAQEIFPNCYRAKIWFLVAAKMETEKHPVVVCTNCYRFARLNLSLMIYYCPMCNKSVTAEEVYDELGEGVRNDG